MNFMILLLLFLVPADSSTLKRHRRKVVFSSNSSDVQNTNIKCHNCRSVGEDFDGFLASANNTSIYELTYGWTIEVPQNHEILLTFSWLSEEFLQNKTSPCEGCKPYFEIIYGYLSSESTFKIDKFYNIRELTNLSVPSHKTEIRFFSGVHCKESQNLENTRFSISFKAIPLEQSWSLYTLLSVLIPGAFVTLAAAYFCVIMRKKEESSQDALTAPIPIYVDLENSSREFKKSQVKGKENKGRGLRLRTHHSSRLEEPKVITVISSLAEPEVSESSVRPEDTVTPDSSNPVQVVVAGTKKHFAKKKLPPKVNLLNRFPRSAGSTPKYASLHDEAYNEDRLSKSEDIIYERRKASRETGEQVFKFDVAPPKEDPVLPPEFDVSVFLDSSSASSAGDSNEDVRELPFLSPKKN